MKKIKVIILGTGNISSYAVKALSLRENIEIIGVWAHLETAGFDIGKDAGELRFNDRKVGVQVTGDLDALIALKPDVAVMGLNCLLIDDLGVGIACKLLKNGINVTGTTLTQLIHPSTYGNREIIKQIEAACTEGNVSFYQGGVHPGFACDFLPSAMLAVANRIENVTALELCNYAMAPNEFEMKNGRGFGMEPEFKAACEDPNFIIGTWGPCVDLIAEALGYKVDRYETSYEKALTDHDLPVGYGTIHAGTVGAVKLTVTGIINGKPAITVGAVNRMSYDVAKDWEFADHTVYRMTLKGDPNMTMDFSYDQNDGAWGYSVTCLRAINAIPYLIDAKPGMLTSLDLPLTCPIGTID